MTEETNPAALREMLFEAEMETCALMAEAGKGEMVEWSLKESDLNDGWEADFSICWIEHTVGGLEAQMHWRLIDRKIHWIWDIMAQEENGDWTVPVATGGPVYTLRAAMVAADAHMEKIACEPSF